MARFLIDNLVDDAYLTVSPGMQPGLPVDNVKKLSKSLVFRSLNSSITTISGLLPYTAPISGFIICGHNFIEGTRYQLQLFSNVDLSAGSLVYNSTLLTVTTTDLQDTARFNNLPIWFPVANAVAFKITMFDSSSNLEYFQVYRVFIGDHIETEVGVSFKHTITWKDSTKQYRTEAGTLRSDVIVPSKTLKFNLDTTNESDRALLQRSLSYIGKRKEFYIDLFPNEVGRKTIDYRGIVKLTKVPKFKEYADNYYKSQYTVEEI